MSQEAKTDQFYTTMIETLVFLSCLTKKELAIFLELFHIAYGKSCNDIKKGKPIDCFMITKIAHFKKKLGISKDTVKRFNKKVRLCFSKFLKIERQKFEYNRLAGYDSVNKYKLKKDVFLGLFLLQKNGFLTSRKNISNSLTQLLEDEQLIHKYFKWAKQKCARSNRQNAPASNGILIEIKMVPLFSSEKVPSILDKTNKYSFQDDTSQSIFSLVSGSKSFGISTNDLSSLLRDYGTKIIEESIQDGIWYEDKGNIINNKTAYLFSRAKKQDKYFRKTRVYRY